MTAAAEIEVASAGTVSVAARRFRKRLETERPLHRWHRFGLNVPAEPETPAQPESVEVNAATPGQVLVSCATVPYAERYRYFIQKAGATGEPSAVGASSEPLFLIEHLDAGGRYNVFVSAVNMAGNEGPRSKAVVADVIAKAA